MPTLVEEKAPSSYFRQRLAQPLPLIRRNTRKRYIGANIRQSIEQVFNGLGGFETMMEWAKDNPDLFYSSVVPKLLPHELAESGLAGNITVIVQRNPVSTPNQQIQVIQADPAIPTCPQADTPIGCGSGLVENA